VVLKAQRNPHVYYLIQLIYANFPTAKTKQYDPTNQTPISSLTSYISLVSGKLNFQREAIHLDLDGNTNAVNTNVNESML
jgi:hypothetical protein